MQQAYDIQAFLHFEAHKCHIWRLGLSASLWKYSLSSSWHLCRRNKNDAERQFCLHLGTTTSSGQHRMDVFVTSAHRQLATCVCYELVHAFQFHSHNRIHNSVWHCQWGCSLGYSSVECEIQRCSWPRFDCTHQTILCHIYLNAIIKASVIASEAHDRVGDE